jgi:transcriptional regulator with XRE-family HTH domain
MSSQQQPTDGEPDEVLVARNIAAARKRKGMSQTALAEHMAARGFPSWRQTTVSRTERGTRQLIVDESRELEQLFGGDIWFGSKLDRTMRRFQNAIRGEKGEIASAQLGRLEDSLADAFDAVHKMRIAFDPTYEPAPGEDKLTIGQLKGRN